MGHAARCKRCGEVVLEDAEMLAGVESVRLFDHLATRHPEAVQAGAPAASVETQYRLEPESAAITLASTVAATHVVEPALTAPPPADAGVHTPPSADGAPPITSATDGPRNGDREDSDAAPLAPILVVEDNPDVREAEAILLECAGYRTVEAENGDVALRVLHAATERPRLILLDLMMPVMDGLAFRRAQLADPALADIPVVVISAFDGVGDADELQVNAFVPKPVDYDRLLATVEEQCGPPA